MEMLGDIIMFKDRPLFQRANNPAPSARMGEIQDFACFFYVVQGTYETIESHGSFRIGAKDALVKKCGNYVAHFLSQNGDTECEAVAIYLYPDILHEIYKNEPPSFLDKSKKIIPPKKLLANELIEKYINNLYMYFDNPEMIDDDLALLKLKELIMLLLKSERYSNVQDFLSELFKPGKLKFTSIIENNLFSEISVEELAFVTGKSLSSFKREFQKIYKMSPAKYIKSRRLDHAAQLLLSSEKPVSSIAYESGFQDPSTFSAAFQHKFDRSPSNYRLDKISK